MERVREGAGAGEGEREGEGEGEEGLGAAGRGVQARGLGEERAARDCLRGGCDCCWG